MQRATNWITSHGHYASDFSLLKNDALFAFLNETGCLHFDNNVLHYITLQCFDAATNPTNVNTAYIAVNREIARFILFLQLLGATAQ